MAEKRAHSPELEELDADTGAITLAKKARTDDQIVVGTVTKEVCAGHGGGSRNPSLQPPAPVMGFSTTPLVPLPSNRRQNAKRP